MKKITTIILLILSMQGYSQQTIKVASSGGTSGGATKYSTTEYGMLTDSATTNLYKFRADSTVLESQVRAVNRAALNVTLAGTQNITGDKTFIGNTVVPNQTYPALTNKAVNSNYVDGAISAKTDTSSLLATQARVVNGLSLKLNISDTASMLANKWGKSGNTLTAGSDFFGSTNNVSLRIRTNGVERAVFDTTGTFTLGTTSTNTGIINLPSGALGISNGITWGSGSGIYRSATATLSTIGSIYSAANIGVPNGGAIINTTSQNNGYLVFNSTGLSAVRNVGDANNALIITQLHSSSTGNILALANSGGTVASVTRSGSLLVGTTTEDVSSSLTIASTTKGVLLSRMTTTQRTAIASPAEGLEVYDLTLHKKYVYDGTIWQACW